LERTDKALLDSVFEEFAPQTSELTFTNLFAWSGTHQVHLARVDRTVLLWRGPDKKGVLLSPLGPLEREGIASALAWAQSMGGPPEFGRLSEQDADRLIEADPGLSKFEDRDNADYVYRVRDLVELQGRAYDGKRNQIKKFNRAVEAAYVPIDRVIVQKCLAMQDCWCDARECSIHADLDAEDRAVKIMLNHYDELGLIGGALVAGEEVVAFSLAEPLSPDTAVVHVEKADPGVPGAYQAINREFCANALAGFEFVNREQDLGVEGLRRAKMSYHPDHLVIKYTVRR